MASALRATSRYTQSPHQTPSAPAKTLPPAPPARSRQSSPAPPAPAAATTQSPALQEPRPKSSAETPPETRTKNFSRKTARHSPAPATSSLPPEFQSGTCTLSLLPAKPPAAQTPKSKTPPSPASKSPPSPETTQRSSPAPPHSTLVKRTSPPTPTRDSSPLHKIPAQSAPRNSCTPPSARRPLLQSLHSGIWSWFVAAAPSPKTSAPPAQTKMKTSSQSGSHPANSPSSATLSLSAASSGPIDTRRQTSAPPPPSPSFPRGTSSSTLDTANPPKISCQSP